MKDEIVSRTVFTTDKEFQEHWNRWFSQNKLDDGFSYLISIDTGYIKKGKKMELTPKKISKSEQKKEEETKISE